MRNRIVQLIQEGTDIDIMSKNSRIPKKTLRRWLKKRYPINEYQDSIVAYIDILGFKSLISNSTKDNKLNGVFELIKILSEVEKENYKKIRGIKNFSNFNISVFSDCFAISIKNQGTHPCVSLLKKLGDIARDLLIKGFLVRGGVAFGKLYHDRGEIFGEALIEAVNLEKTSVHPRTILTKDILKLLRAEQNTNKSDIDSQLINKNDDNQSSINFLHPTWPGGSKWNLSDYSTIKNTIEKQLELYIDEQRIFEKWDWIAKYYNATLTRHPQELPMMPHINLTQLNTQNTIE